MCIYTYIIHIHIHIHIYLYSDYVTRAQALQVPMVLMDRMEHLALGAFQDLQGLQEPSWLKQTKNFQELKRFQHRRSRIGSATIQNAP
jgi:hypothetical protein